MPTLYRHLDPNARAITYAHARQSEIRRQIEQLELEHALMQQIIDAFDPAVCVTCKGEKSIMIPIDGCEVDGPRMHRCPTCKGTGLPEKSVPTGG